MDVWLPHVVGGSGADVFVERLAVALTGQGVNVRVSEFPHVYQYVLSPLRRAPCPPGTDVIIANASHGFAFSRRGIPLIAVEHHCVVDPALAGHRSVAQAVYHRAVVKRRERRSFRRASATVAVSEYTATVVRGLFAGVNPEVILNGVDVEAFQRHPHRPVSAEVPFRILFVGNPSRRKGSDLLGPIARALGPGFQVRATNGLRGEASDEAGIRWLGHLSKEELIDEYSRADVLLMPSRLEGFGFAAAEAMACSLPVVASNSSSLPEIVVDRVTGRLCKPEEPEAFADAIRWCVADPERHSRLRENARQRAVSDFGLERLGREYGSLCKRIVAASHSSATRQPGEGDPGSG